MTVDAWPQAPGSRLLLDRLGRQFATAGHAAVSVPAVAFGVALAPPAGRGLAVLLGVVVLVWSACYRRALELGSGWLFVGVDVAVVSAAALTAAATVPRTAIDNGGTGWVVVFASFSLVVLQLVTSSTQGVVAVVLVDAALLAGIAASPDGWTWRAVSIAVWVVAEAGLTRLLWWLVRRGGAHADVVAATAVATRQAAAVATAGRAEERQYAATLHDTVATTLLMVGLGEVHATDRWLRPQVARDLEALALPDIATAELDGDDVDLVPILAALYVGAAVCVIGSHPDAVSVPRAVAEALGGAVREALTNVARHAGADHARVDVVCVAGRVEIEITDDGIGFDPERRRDFRRGVNGSIRHRLAAVGGSALISSGAGAGTSVVLRWPDGEKASPTCCGTEPPASAEATIEYFLRGLRVAAAAIGAIILAASLPLLLVGLGGFRLEWAETGGYAVLVAVLAVEAVLIVRERGWGRAAVPVAVGLLLVSAVARVGLPPGEAFVPSDWALGCVGWICVVVLFDRAVPVIAGFVMANMALNGILMVLLSGQVDVAVVLTYALLTVAISSFQLAVCAAIVALRRVAGVAAAAAQQNEVIATRQAIAVRLHEDRRRRYLGLTRDLRPLLIGLGDGSVDPSEEQTQRRCSIEAARMRRLFAESDDADDPLLHELRACIDLAERRGVTVGLCTRGAWPVLPRGLRRALTDAPLAVLATAATTARVTVTGTPSGVAVSVVADARPLDSASVSDVADVEVSTLYDDGELWVKSQWTTDR